jgi:HPt (histidine-containing phosphotransfer) domain-containing protein
MTGDRERCLAAGMDDYLSKPLRPELLDEVLERWLGVTVAASADGDDEAEDREAAIDALIDAARMRTFREDYPDIVEQLLQLFVDSTPELLEELHAAVEAGDADERRRAAHKLKGSCQNIGATFMASLCLSLESDELDPAATLAQLDDAFHSTEAALRRELTVA